MPKSNIELCNKLPGIATDKRRDNEKNGISSYQVLDIDTNSQQNSRKRGHIEDDLVGASDSGDNSSKRRKVDDGHSKGGAGGSGSEEGDDSSQAPSSVMGGSGDGQPPPSSLNLSPPVLSPSKKFIQNTLGINAWKKWVTAKNEELSKIGERQFGTELLWLSSEELCESLSLFVTEFCKPSGQPYPADVLYYLVLGIQKYLIENGREDNLFSDLTFDKFTDTFNEIITKDTLLDNSEFLIPRIEEGHLWEAQQLGMHSPFTLLLTMLYFTTKGFNIVNIDSHMTLAFSQLMRQWPRNQNSSEKQIIKHRTLRYFPPNSKGDNSKDSNSSQENKKKYEMQENCDDLLRCPVGLYHYYVSKCPESVRHRSDIFYLRPERSYLCESPFWYTSEPLDRNVLTKMFNRLRLVKEISLVLSSESESSSE